MAEIDATQAPNPSSVPFRDLALRYGAIWGVAGIFLSLISFLSNTEPGLPDTDGTWKALYSIVGIGMAVWAIVTAIKTDRDEQLGGYISLGRCLGLGALTSLVAAVISILYFYIHITFINPDYLEVIRDAAITQMEEQGKSESEIEQAMKFASFFMGPVFISIIQFVFTMFLGFIISLIAGMVLKREHPMS